MRARQLSILAIIAMSAGLAAGGQSGRRQPACDPDNGGITLPEGFCAVVVADGLGPARHLTVAPNGDLFVALRNTREAKGGIVALRDTDGDGKADVRERFGEDGGTGIALRRGYLYFARDTAVVRYPLKPGELKPAGPVEVVVGGFPDQRAHAAKSAVFDDAGSMYVNIGAPSNACQGEDRKPKVPGQDPCPLLERHGGVWRYAEDRLGQDAYKDGQRYATGMRQNFAMAWHNGRLYLVQHGRDQLDTLWPGLFTAEQNAELPSEEFLLVEEGADFGWPYCYHDWQQQKRVLAPEYGGDGKQVGRCDRYPAPIMAFPGHWAPNALLFYTGTQFPKRYQGGAFIAFHGSWNRAPLPQGGYNVVFVPFAGPKPSGPYEIFADRFAGRTPLLKPDEAAFRPSGLAQGPDGSLYISDSQKGRIWRVLYRGGSRTDGR
jgi:glucose/arabinose dehydrogenase